MKQCFLNWNKTKEWNEKRIEVVQGLGFAANHRAFGCRWGLCAFVRQRWGWPCVSGGFRDNENNSFWFMGRERRSPERVEEKGLSKIRPGIMCCVIALSHTLMVWNNSVNQTECHVTPRRQVCSTYADVHPDLECLNVLGKEVYNTWREKYPLAFLFISMEVAMHCKNVLEGKLCERYLISIKKTWQKYMVYLLLWCSLYILVSFFTYIFYKSSWNQNWLCLVC